MELLYSLFAGHCLTDGGNWFPKTILLSMRRFFGENKDYQWTWNGCEHSQVVSAAPALRILHIYLSIYLFIYLPTWLVGGGVWSECVVLVHRDHWRCVHLFPCRSMTHTSPLPPSLFSVYIHHCVHMSSHQTPAHWREIRSDHYILILPRTYTRYTVPCPRIGGTCLTYISMR